MNEDIDKGSQTLACPEGDSSKSSNEVPTDAHLGICESCESIGPQVVQFIDLDQRQIDSVVGAVNGGAENVQNIHPLSSVQAGILFSHLRNEESNTYVLSALLELKSHALIPDLIRALQEVINRYDALRAAFVWEKLSAPVQVIHRRAQLLVESLEIDPSREAIEQLCHRMRSECRSFDLRRAPLVKVQVARRQASPSYAIIRLHHAICDHQSWGAVIDEVAMRMGGQEPLTATTVHSPDDLDLALQEPSKSGETDFFRAKLRDLNEPTAPFGLLNVHGDGTGVVEARCTLDPELAAAIRSQSLKLGVSAARIFHAAWSLVVARTSGKDDVTFGTVLSITSGERGRARDRAGAFVNTLPLRLKLRGISAVELVERVERELRELLAFRRSSLEIAQSCSGIAASAPLFTAVLNYRYSVGHPVVDPRAASNDASGVRVIGYHERTNHPISLTVESLANGFSLAAFTERAVDPTRLTAYLETALRSLIGALQREPHKPALALEVIPAHERREIVRAFNSKVTTCPQELLHQLFEEQAMQSPDSAALLFEGRALTYAELNGKANQLARYLTEKGVSQHQIVGICMQRSLELVIGVLAVWKAGCAYVPLDPDQPIDRLAFMIEQSAPRTILTQEAHASRAAGLASGLVICVDNCWSDAARYETSNLKSDTTTLNAHQLAYVIYTSGSTGRPKGVMIEHRSVVNLWRGLERLYESAEPCRHVALNASLSFDASVQQLVQLLSGRTLVLVPQESRLDVAKLGEFLRDERIDAIDCTPSQLKAWRAAGLLERSDSTLKLLLVGGEGIDTGLWSTMSQRQFATFNVYGPTECTVDATAARIHAGTELPHIGSPMDNRSIYILDSDLRLVPMGTVGEIYIGGEGVGRGYIDRTAMTAERFLADPFHEGESNRMYRTGDLGRWRADGTIEHLGRNDSQVKVRGYRIELGEIEVRLAQHASVKEAAVIVREEDLDDRRLVAYVVSDRPNELAIESLRSHLRSTLPDYMIPAAFVMLDRLPLTISGKLDRRALPAPGGDESVTNEYAAPHGEVETILSEIWQSLLRVQRIGRKDDLFELGAHSMLVLKAVVRINEALRLSLSVADIYKNRTIAALAEKISGTTMVDEPVVLSKEAVLDDGIVPLPGSPRTPAEKILLTGATGFIGRFLLEQLLRDTRATIYCLVRAQSNREAADRIRSNLEKWNLWREEFQQRIVALAGDLRRPGLGIGVNSHSNLRQELDSVYHCATSMNHLETYDMAKPANVESARELLRLAVSGRPKSINYISTVSIFSSSDNGAVRIVHEGSPIDDEQHRTSIGYAASKWVGEKIFVNANERGASCNIFRLGLVWGDSQQGRYDELQRDYRIMKSCLLSGLGIKSYRQDPSPLPVDYVVRAIVFLANRHAQGGGIFHLSSMSVLDDVFERCNACFGTNLRLLSTYDWICELKRLHQEGRDLPAIPLIEFAFALDERSFHEQQDRLGRSRVRVDSARTQKELMSAGIIVPDTQENLLRVCLESMLTRDEELMSRGETGERSRLQRVQVVRDYQAV